MNKYYSSEKNVQILIALLKEHGIRKVIVSPGATNVCFVGSIQNDEWFDIYSCVDERSAAYMACGLAAETGEPVVLSCTGATASRNYIPGLTEAYYRKLPILAITSTQHIGRIGNNIPQVIDRTQCQKDIVKLSIHLPNIHDSEDKWAAELNINRALIKLKDDGGSPVHINLTTTYSKNFSVKVLPEVKVIKKIRYGENFPKIMGTKIGIFVGAHKKWSKELSELVDKFCAKYNGVVFCDHTSNYKGKYRINGNLICSQPQRSSIFKNLNTIIHMGEISGAYMDIFSKEVWRIDLDGEIKDTYKRLTYTFEMKEEDFFRGYIRIEDKNIEEEFTYLKECKKKIETLLNKIPELPFSNIWIAKNSINLIPKNAVLHLGILNSLRAWNYFDIPNEVLCFSNTGGFGIDGILSSVVGASLANDKKKYFCILGDLAFFYDINALGNCHIGNNLRIMLINNGKGTEFKNYSHNAAHFGDKADKYIAAAGHFGNKSKFLVKNFVENLGFNYISASNKKEYLESVEYFFNDNKSDRSIVFEVFTESFEESEALKIIENLEVEKKTRIKSIIKKFLRKV